MSSHQNLSNNYSRRSDISLQDISTLQNLYDHNINLGRQKGVGRKNEMPLDLQKAACPEHNVVYTDNTEELATTVMITVVLHCINY